MNRLLDPQSKKIITYEAIDASNLAAASGSILLQSAANQNLTLAVSGSGKLLLSNATFTDSVSLFQSSFLITPNSLTANRILALPNNSGTLALLSDITAGSGLQSITVNTSGVLYPASIVFGVAGTAATGNFTLNTVGPNLFLAGPTSGAASTPTFRTINALDVPSLDPSVVLGAGSSAVSIRAGGTDQNINITPTGTGAIVVPPASRIISISATNPATVSLVINTYDTTGYYGSDFIHPLNGIIRLSEGDFGGPSSSDLRIRFLPQASSIGVVETYGGELHLQTKAIPSGDFPGFEVGNNIVFKINNAAVGTFSLSGLQVVSINSPTELTLSAGGSDSDVVLEPTGAGWVVVDGPLELINESVAPVTPSNSLVLFADSSNRFSWKGTNGFVRTFDGTSNTANRIYTLPNKSGTVAMFDDIPAPASNQSANTIYAGPTTGSAALPTFRALVAADIPSLDWTKITTGKPTTISGYGITDTPLLLNISNGATTANTSIVIGNTYNLIFGFGGGPIFQINHNNGSSGQVGFFGATPVAQQSGNIATALSNFGLVTSGTLPYSSLTGTPTVPTVASTSSILKGDGSGNAIAATVGTDYISAGSSNTFTASQQISFANTDTTNTSGANSHILLNNSSSSGSTIVYFNINGAMSGKIRADYAKNMNYIQGVGGGAHKFWVGGDVGVGTIAFQLNSSAQLIAGTSNIQLTDTSGHILTTALNTVDITQGGTNAVTASGARTNLGLGTSATTNIAWTIKTANYTAISGDKILANTSGGTFTITAPASPSNGDTFTVTDAQGTFATNNLTISRNSQSIAGAATDLVVSTNNAAFTLVFAGGSMGWQVMRYQ